MPGILRGQSQGYALVSDIRTDHVQQRTWNFGIEPEILVLMKLVRCATLPAVLLLASIVRPGAAETRIQVNAQLPWHPAVTDAQGKLLAWYQPEKNLGYDKV